MPSSKEVSFQFMNCFSFIPHNRQFSNFLDLALAVDDMGSRIDELEKSIGELMTQAGIEESTPAIEDK
jgi:hypothetical protein